jgi:hypothetical protein
VDAALIRAIGATVEAKLRDESGVGSERTNGMSRR